MNEDVYVQKKLNKMTNLLKNPVSFRAFTLGKMPLGFLAGLHVLELDETNCKVGIPGGWRTQNPFKSMYWAAQGMAAEMAAGLHPAIYTSATDTKVNMILAKCEGRFTRQCIGKGTFVCNSGDAIRRAVAETAVSGERVPCPVIVTGHDPDGHVVSEWEFTWSFKGKPSV